MHMDHIRFRQNINWINQYLLNNQKLSLSEFLGWPAHIVTALTEGVAPTLDQLSKLHNQLSISIQDLIENDISTDKSMKWLQFGNNTIDENFSKNTFFEVPLNIRKAGASNFSAVRPLKKSERHQAKICVPSSMFQHQNPEKLKAFEIEGFSMHPLVRSGDVVIAEQLPHLLKFKEGDPYILMLKDGSLFFKRLFKVRNEPGKIQLLSDNPDFPQITLGVNLIAECWRICHCVRSTEL